MAGQDRPLKRSYARIERERRFVLSTFPEGIHPESYSRLRDCFILGTFLRLRIVESPDGTVQVVKLGQKTVDPEAPDDPYRRSMTTIYLTEAEGRTLSLTGRQSTKRRYEWPEQGHTFCIDVWEEPKTVAGLILAEVECPTDAALAAIRCPDWADREVTLDPSYSAFTLAGRLTPL